MHVSSIALLVSSEMIRPELVLPAIVLVAIVILMQIRNYFYYNIFSCTACVSGYHLDDVDVNLCICDTGFFKSTSDITCVSSCTGGFYGNTLTHACTSCDPACSLCTGGANYQCQAC